MKKVTKLQFNLIFNRQISQILRLNHFALPFRNKAISKTLFFFLSQIK